MMRRSFELQRCIHECSKVLVLVGIALLITAGALFTAETAAQDKLDTLEARAQRYRQTEYAQRYASHARRADKRVDYLQGLVDDWGNPLPPLGLILFGGLLLGASRPQPTTRRKHSRGRRPPGSQQPRPQPAQPQTSRSGLLHRPSRIPPAPGAG